MPLANRLKQIRMQEYQMNQKEFRIMLGIDVASTYSQIESGKRVPGMEFAYEIAAKLNRSVDDIWYR